MAEPGLRVIGGRELRRTLRAAGLSMDDLKAAHRAAAEVVANAARPPVLTGRLAGSVRPAGQTGRAVVRAGSAALPYGPPIHWGWAARNIAAQPFLSDAMQRTQPTWESAYAAEVDRITSTVTGAPTT